MSNYLNILEDAITDVGKWTWWTASLPNSFQVEFSAVQLWNPPLKEGLSPSGQIALRFVKPRLIYFLTSGENTSRDWSDQLHRDEITPINLGSESFTLTSSGFCGALMERNRDFHALIGDSTKERVIRDGESLLGIDCGNMGLVVAASSMVVVNHQGELDPKNVIENNKKWWDYWREYWRSKDTDTPFPRDYACEVTIPAAGALEQ